MEGKCRHNVELIDSCSKCQADYEKQTRPVSAKEMTHKDLLLILNHGDRDEITQVCNEFKKLADENIMPDMDIQATQLEELCNTLLIGMSHVEADECTEDEERLQCEHGYTLKQDGSIDCDECNKIIRQQTIEVVRFPRHEEDDGENDSVNDDEIDEINGGPKNTL